MKVFHGYLSVSLIVDCLGRYYRPKVFRLRHSVNLFIWMKGARECTSIETKKPPSVLSQVRRLFNFTIPQHEYPQTRASMFSTDQVYLLLLRMSIRISTEEAHPYNYGWPKISTLSRLNLTTLIKPLLKEVKH